MNAVVAFINPRRGRVAASIEEDEFVIFDLLGDYEIEIGDVVGHKDFSSMGTDEYLNLTTGEPMDVFVRAFCGGIRQASEQCLF